MKHVDSSQRYVPVIAVVTAVLLLTCLGLNVHRQAKLQGNLLAAKANVAVFLSPDAVVENVTARLVATGRVERTDYITREAVYEKMSAADSPIKEMLVPGENPFSPYCLVYLKNTTLADAKAVAGAALKVDGVQDARFDEELLTTTERLTVLRRFYQTGLLMVFVVLSLVAGFHLTNTLTGGKFNYPQLGKLIVSGVIAGFLAMAFYVLLVRYCAAEPVASLSLKYLLTMLPGGILLSVVLGLKR
jgi:cell division protein FtsX